MAKELLITFVFSVTIAGWTCFILYMEKVAPRKPQYEFIADDQTDIKRCFEEVVCK